jgi:hypothetical protein
LVTNIKYNDVPRTMVTASILHTAVLTCHPGMYSKAVHGLEARVRRTESEEIALTYILKGEIARLKIPTPRLPRIADRLWEHTCFEVFVCMKDKPQYCEFNFAPSGEWAAYAFHRYRDGGSLDNEELAPTITVRKAKDSLEVEAIIRLDRLPMIQAQAWLRLALSAVVEEENGVLSYWALKHPPGKPDFHSPDSFALELAPVAPEAINRSPVRK